MASRPVPKPRAVSSGSLAMWLSLLVAASVRAEPQVRVQARTRIVLQTTRTADGIEIAGTLRDDADVGLANRPLALEIATPDGRPVAPMTALRSAEDGGFAAAVELPQASYRLRLRFGGNAHYAASEVERPIDLTRSEVRLDFIEPATAALDLDRAQHPILLRASSAGGGAGLALVVQDERGRTLASV